MLTIQVEFIFPCTKQVCCSQRERERERETVWIIINKKNFKIVEMVVSCVPCFSVRVGWEHSTIQLSYNLTVYPCNDKILDWSRFKAFSDDKLNVTKMIISGFDRAENIVGKGEIACTSNFSFSHKVFRRLLSHARQMVSLCGNGLIYGSGTIHVKWNFLSS